MTSKRDFAEDEWAHIVRAPFLVGMAVSLSDPGGPIEATKETVATLKSATNPPSREQLLTEVALDVQSMTQSRHNPLGGYRPDSHLDPRDQVLEDLRTVRELIAASATPEESTAFGLWMVEVAQAAADAAKEGGFMGIGAKRVSDREQSMLDRVRELFAG